MRVRVMMKVWARTRTWAMAWAKPSSGWTVTVMVTLTVMMTVKVEGEIMWVNGGG